MKITGLSHLFKWENLHNWWLTKYFFAPLYVPWGGRDIETLKSKLPSLRDGANKWIASFEDETAGDMIAVGDIKVLLSKVLTRQEMEDILEDAGMKDAVGCEDYNGQSLNTYRAELWGTLRQVSHKNVQKQAADETTDI